MKPTCGSASAGDASASSVAAAAFSEVSGAGDDSAAVLVAWEAVEAVAEVVEVAE